MCLLGALAGSGDALARTSRHCARYRPAEPSTGEARKTLYESSTTYPYPRGLAGPEIVDFGVLNGPLLPQSRLERVGGEAPHLFQWVLR